MTIPIDAIIAVTSFIVLLFSTAIHSSIKIKAYNESKRLGEAPSKKIFKIKTYEFRFWSYISKLSEKPNNVVLKKMSRISGILFGIRIISMIIFIVSGFHWITQK